TASLKQQQFRVNPVLRISQLDALELDSSLEQLMWSQFSRCFQNFRPGLLTPAEPELRALLHLLVWKFTLYPNSATVGQSILNVRYHNTLSASPRYRPLSRRQKLGLALLTVGPRWLQERSHNLLVAFGLVCQSFQLLVFLQKGQHPVLAERIVGARAVFSKPNVVRDISYQYMNRELLWHGFAEFLIYFLPLINTHKIKTAIYSTIFGRRSEKEEGRGGEWPTMPHTVGSHSIADAYLTCPKCGAEAGQPLPVVMELEER
uniref:RING-type E3 ubiquitin transferase (cysteine targeting) n=1 Tax=Neogobius melanostomus TaxID=47308 RepID=A0A8C6T2N9_9GOBI